MGVAKQRKDHVAPRIDVVNRDDQLSKTRLSEIVGKQFDIPSCEIVRLRPGNWRRAAAVPSFCSMRATAFPRKRRGG